MADVKKMLAELLARQDEPVELSDESRKAVVDEFREAIAADVVAKLMPELKQLLLSWNTYVHCVFSGMPFRHLYY
jgi:hypothetical protein